MGATLASGHAAGGRPAAGGTATVRRAARPGRRQAAASMPSNADMYCHPCNSVNGPHGRGVAGHSMAQQGHAQRAAPPPGPRTFQRARSIRQRLRSLPSSCSRAPGPRRGHSMTERVQSPRPGRYGLSAVGQLFSKDTQAIFYNWCAVGGCADDATSDSRLRRTSETAGARLRGLRSFRSALGSSGARATAPLAPAAAPPPARPRPTLAASAPPLCLSPQEAAARAAHAGLRLPLRCVVGRLLRSQGPCFCYPCGCSTQPAPLCAARRPQDALGGGHRAAGQRRRLPEAVLWSGGDCHPAGKRAGQAGGAGGRWWNCVAGLA